MNQSEIKFENACLQILDKINHNFGLSILLQVHEYLGGTPSYNIDEVQIKLQSLNHGIISWVPKVFFRMRREFSVLAERHIFGRRTKAQAAKQKPETALEKSLKPKVGDLRHAEPGLT